MGNLKARSDVAYKLNNGQPVDLTTTLSGTGSADAVVLGKQIIINFDTAEHTNTVTITTPLGFRVLNAHTIAEAASAATLIIKNAAGVISSTITMTADTDIDVITTIDDTYSTFARGDDDLVITIGTADCTGTMVIDIEPTIA
jgi:hypothetical protein